MKKPPRIRLKYPLLAPREKSQVRTLRANLCGKYPVLAENRPLALGIIDQLTEAEPLPREILSLVLELHVNRTAYLKQMSQAQVRYNLDGGEAAGTVNRGHRINASKRVRRRLERRKAAKKKAAPQRRRKSRTRTKMPTELENQLEHRHAL